MRFSDLHRIAAPPAVGGSVGIVRLLTELTLSRLTGADSEFSLGLGTLSPGGLVGSVSENYR